MWDLGAIGGEGHAIVREGSAIQVKCFKEQVLQYGAGYRRDSRSLMRYSGKETYSIQTSRTSSNTTTPHPRHLAFNIAPDST